MDETCIKVKGQWRYLYRAVDKHGQTIDFLLTEQRDEQAATRFLTKAIRRHGVPENDHDRRERGPCRGHPDLQPGARDHDHHAPGEIFE